MPSTYTLNNGIELIATGEQSGTWGDTTNTNLELLDTALDGQVTVTLSSAGSSGSPNTLPISDGAASNGRNRMVIFNDSSDLGATAYVQLTPNDAEKIIYVRNSLSGDRSILLFQGTYSASNDYELKAGKSAVIYFDGAGSGAVAANVLSTLQVDALLVDGAVTIATGDSGATASSNADDLVVEASGDGGISILNPASNTGTLFFGDPSAGNMGQIKYSHTDDAMSIVTAQNTAIVIDSSRRVLIGTGTARADLFNTTATAALQVEGTTGNTSAASIVRNSNDDNGPQFVLGKSNGTSVGSDTVVTADALLGRISYQGADGSELVEGARIETQVAGTPGSNDMPGRLQFYTTADGASTPTERMRITAGGDLGLGTTNPDGRMHVAETDSVTYSSSAIQGDLVISRKNSSGTNNEVVGLEFNVTQASGVTTGVAGISAIQPTNASSADLVFQTRNAGTVDEAMRITAAQKVLIGATSTRGTYGLTVAEPSDGIRILGIASGGMDALHLDQARGSVASPTASNANGDGSYISFSSYDGTNFDDIGSLAVVTDGSQDSGRMIFRTTPTGGSQTEHMRINQNGFVGIGGATDPSYQLDVKKAGTTFARVIATTNNTRAGYLAQSHLSDGTDINMSIGVFGDANQGEISMATGHPLLLYTNNDPSKGVELQVDGDLNIKDGNLVLANGHGIDFSATGEASGQTSELFDDYEEGTWTPYLARWSGGAISATYTEQIGRYTKVGRLVTVSFSVITSAISSQGTSILFLGGLPYNNDATHNYLYAGTFGSRTAISDSTVATGIIKHSTNNSLLFRQNNDFDENVDDAWLVGTMRGSITYEYG